MGSVRVGRLMGLEIRVDLSWLLIFVLILWTLTAAYFPTRQPGLAYESYLAMGVIGTLLFFASLAVHELAHVVVARWRGIPVDGVTFFVFGGVASSRREAGHPIDEVLIAGAGVFSSLGLAALFFATAWLGLRLGWRDAAVGVVDYLALVNALVALFNLLPGFPLDGGRLFRALVWKLTGERATAVRWGETGARWLSATLVALGVLQLFLGGVITGLWLIFLGWFVQRPAAPAASAPPGPIAGAGHNRQAGLAGGLVNERVNVTELLLHRRQQGGRWRHSLRTMSDGEAVLGRTTCDCRVEVEPAGTLTLRTAGGGVLDLDAAVEAGLIAISSGHTPSVLNQLFQMAMYNEVRAELIFRLLRLGENALEWDLEVDDQGVSLIDAQGHTRVTISNPFWWQVHDTEFVAELAAALVVEAGLGRELAIH